MFDTSLLSAEPARYTMIVEACIPIILVGLSGLTRYGPSNKSGNVVVGRPPAYMFAVVWVMIAICMFFSLFITSLNMDITSLWTIGIFSLLTIIGCVAWVICYVNNKKTYAQYILFMVLLSSCLLMNFGWNSTSIQDEHAPLVVGALSTPLFVWIIIANMLSLFELNMV